MEAFMNVVQSLTAILLVVILLGLFFLLTMINQTSRRLNRLKRRYDLMLRGADGLDLEEYLTIIGNTLYKQDERLKAVEEGQKEQLVQLANALTKVGFVRYAAFGTEENPLSWSLALLDRHNDGVVITTIHGREGTTTFAKEIEKGEAKAELSEEEQQAYESALERFDNA